MATVPGIFLGGTAGARDGTLVAAGNPITLPADGSVVTVHYRLYDSITLGWNYDESTNVIDVTLPVGALGSFTFGGTYVADPTVGATKLTGDNQPLYLKAAEGATPGSFVFTVVGDTLVSVLLFADDFSGAAGSPDPLAWSPIVGGASSSVALNGTGQMVLTDGSAVQGDYAAVVRLDALTKGVAYKAKVKFTATATTGGAIVPFMGVMTHTTTPEVVVDGVVNNARQLFYARALDDSDTDPFIWWEVIMWDEAGTAIRWRESDDTWGAQDRNTLVAEDTYYWVTVETDIALGWRVTLESADESTTLSQTAWRTWETTRAANDKLYVYSGFPVSANTDVVTLIYDEWMEY